AHEGRKSLCYNQADGHDEDQGVPLLAFLARLWNQAWNPSASGRLPALAYRPVNQKTALQALAVNLCIAASCRAGFVKYNIAIRNTRRHSRGVGTLGSGGAPRSTPGD